MADFSNRLDFYYITPDAIGRETGKAIHINGVGWLPKSQIEWWEKDDICILVLPAWLAIKKGMSFFDIKGSPLGGSLDEETLAGAREISDEVYQKEEEHENQDEHPF